ncbi:MAG: hypothetical protein H6733_09205 [Alphaproteobacteria bacterium]|nr:hypothetical protein [Alphaproteobacteria bacterium]
MVGRIGMAIAAVLAASLARAQDAPPPVDDAPEPMVDPEVDRPPRVVPEAQTPPPAPRQVDNLLGGRIVDRRVGYVSLGYADLEGGFRFPLSMVEVGTRVRLSFPAGCCGGTATPLAATAAFDLRWQLFDNGAVQGSVVASVPVHLGFGPGYPFEVGVGLLHPGWMMTTTIAKRVDVDFGLILHDDLWVAPGAVIFLGSVPIVAGGEVRVTDRISLAFRFEGGPSFALATAAIDVYGHGPVTVTGGGVTARIRVLAGATFAL